MTTALSSICFQFIAVAALIMVILHGTNFDMTTVTYAIISMGCMICSYLIRIEISIKDLGDD